MPMKWSGKNLADLRSDADMSQRRLSEMVHLSPCMISGFEHNTKTPSVETLMRFSEIFQVSTDFLLGITDLKTMPDMLKKDFANGKPYHDVLEMMESLTKEQRESLYAMARFMQEANNAPKR